LAGLPPCRSPTIVIDSATTRSDSKKSWATLRFTRRASACDRSFRSARATKYDESATSTASPLDALLRCDRVAPGGDDSDDVVHGARPTRSDDDRFPLEGPLQDVSHPDVGGPSYLLRDDGEITLRDLRLAKHF